ncbi:MOSC N-terminal beta barrel domain-containing protein [Geodermatophilus saharensis]|uniref:MOSC N-terminal beta barrel domain-containing protein n=1 Tax=Geodermatophilus saharensis TaxID=1137994 RepID=UPI000B78BCF7|nr:MOSC domain-containing protein [Geodermatophilus saharensis]
MSAGTVVAVSVYPVRGCAGTPLQRADVGPAGLAGDRACAVAEADGRVLRGKDAPELAGVVPTGSPDLDAAAVSAALGRPVRIRPLTGRPDGAAAVHLVSRQALERAAAGVVPAGCGAEDPRANLVLDLPAGDDERTWVGRRLRLGSVVLEVTRLPKHCLGVYAEVAQPGTVAVGDPVQPVGGGAESAR